MSVFEKLYLLLFNAVTDALGLMQSGHAQAAAELLVRAQQACEELYRVSAQRRYARKKSLPCAKGGGTAQAVTEGSRSTERPV